MNSLIRLRWLRPMIPATMAVCCVAAFTPTAMADATGRATVTGTGNGEAIVTGLSGIADGLALQAADCPPLLRHQLRPLMAPEPRPLCEAHAGKVLLVVNTASKCGFTPQFESLEALHQHYSEQGFEVLGFPSDDFRQELASEAAVAEFCKLNYGVSFPMYQKVHVISNDAHPFFRDLAATTGSYPKWNFNKYLINRDGEVVEHYGSSVQPLGGQLVRAIEALL